jgi:response regulator RpfG family c-di-GMP phosphodiesterase/tRNA A-37 threonylcarbamoyl transferase component Bud32
MLPTSQTWMEPEAVPIAEAVLAAHSPHALLDHLLESSIIRPEQWTSLASESRAEIDRSEDRETLVRRLAELNLVNDYQANRIRNGMIRGLNLGNYRVLGRLGAGGMGTVYAAEHILMDRPVAIKVVPVRPYESTSTVSRFLREMRSVARLNHPNIVAAFDAGVAERRKPNEPDLYYFVMEQLKGQPLDEWVKRDPLTVSKACALMYQIASALDEAHRHELVHRDVKPSNVFITYEGHAKLLDFGLVRHQSGNAVTSPGVVVGTPEYMAPEQSLDATRVDIRTDIFGLGATLFFALTGESPFHLDGSIVEIMRRRQTEAARSVRTLRGDVPPALDKILQRMLALRPADRFGTPRAVMNALLPFLESESRCPGDHLLDSDVLEKPTAEREPPKVIRPRVLVAYHEPNVRRSLVRLLQINDLDGWEAPTLVNLDRQVRQDDIEVVLLGAEQMNQGGHALLQSLRSKPPCRNLKILMISPKFSAKDIAVYLAAGANDCLHLPISNVQFVARVKAALREKEVQDRSDELGRQLRELNAEIEVSLHARTADLMQARNALVVALARLVEHRSPDGIAHLTRMQRYCTELAHEAAVNPVLASRIDDAFVQSLEAAVPLHDIGNVGLPDDILFKTGRLEANEREIMERHTVIGAQTLEDVRRLFGGSVAFLGMAIDIARHHHEQFAGGGYPDRLAGEAIPLAARIVAIADNYDALRARRAQRAGFTHAAAVQIITESSPGKFDPHLLAAFERCAGRFEKIFAEVPEQSIAD